jgi:hypothetical protein
MLPDDLQTFDGGGPGGSGDEPPDAAPMACGTRRFAVDRVPPEIVVVMDRSGSMMRTVAGDVPMAGQSNKWGLTVSALNEVIKLTQANVFWGMKMYPSFPLGGACGVEGLTLDPALDRQPAMSSLMTMNSPTLDKGATPTGAAVDLAVELLKARNNLRPKYLLVATDGFPNCKNGSDAMLDADGAVASVVRAEDAGFQVFVVGIATSTGMAHDTLNMMATAGGRPRAGDVKYYPANSKDELIAAVTDIAAKAVTCTFSLGLAPPEDAETAVDADGTRVPMSMTEGWSFGPGKKTIELHGMLCQKLRNGMVKDTKVTFGCPGKPIPPPDSPE